MELNQRQFDLLVLIEQSKSKKLTQRALASGLGVSLGLVNKVLSELLEADLIKVVSRGVYQVLELGYSLLEPYRVKRAIFFAAGFGERLIPLTKTTAKSLLEIKGVRIIDSMIDALLEVGISDITIVRGYLKEQFDVLLDKYPSIHFVDNDLYATSKNLSSAVLVKDIFANAYIIEADILLKDSKLIQKYEYSTHYKSVAVDRSDAWCFETQGTKIKNYSLGGVNVDEMVGISYWTAEDAKRLAFDLEAEFLAPAGMERFWDDVALTLRKGEYAIEVKRYEASDVVELRSVEQYYELNQ